jgi:hypothetical protein
MVIRLLQVRLFLLLPMALATYYLSVGIGNVSIPLASVLIVRRMSEWIGEIALSKHESMNQTKCAKNIRTGANNLASMPFIMRPAKQLAGRFVPVAYHQSLIN